MSINTLYPATKPSFMADFSNAKRLEPRFTFARTTTATHYDGVTTAKAEENLLHPSEQFNDAAWSKTNATVTANDTTAPDGTSTADKMTASAGTNIDVSFARFNLGVTADRTYIISVFAKAGTASVLQIMNVNFKSSSQPHANFDLSGGVLGTAENCTASIESVGNSWYRCSISFSSTNTNSIGGVYYSMHNSTTASRGQDWSPAGTETIYLWGAQLEERASIAAYTPTTTKAISNYVPVLQTAAAGVARFDHNPVTGESLGLLVESASTNVILQSEDLNTTWSATRATLALNSVVSPAGTLTADRLIASTDNNTHFASQTFTGTAAAYTFSVYAKASGLNHIALRLFNGAAQVGLAYYNLSTGATGTVTAGTAAIQSVGNGWYRCSLTATLAASASCTADIQLANADNTNSFAGNAFNGVTLWGMQVELGSFATSYIQTTAATVTRNADAISMTGTNFSSWYNASEGTLFADINPRALSVTSGFQLNDNTTNNRIRLATNSTSDQGLITTRGAAQATLDGGTPAANTNMKLALAYKADDFALSLNGGAVATDTAGAVPIVNQLQIGAETSTVGNVTVRKIAYYPIRCTNTQLQAITT